MIFNLYVPKSRALKYMKQKLMKLHREIDISFVIVGNSTNFLSMLDRSSKQESSKNIVELNYIINQFNVMDMYRIHNPMTEGHTLFLNSHELFTKIDYL